MVQFPSTARHQGDPHAQVLHVGDDLSQILFRADHERAR
jgi:hypothetical protein